MQQGVDLANRTCDRRVGLRVGISGGEVATEEGDYFGDPVVEAARLCARCESGQILAAESCRPWPAGATGIECRPVGDLELKGLPEPVETVEVTVGAAGRRRAGGAVPLPARLAVRPTWAWSAETARWRPGRRHQTGGDGGGREVVLVSGEAGLGKTTLVAEAARAACDVGATVLFGHCEEDLATPYQLFAEALGHFVTHAPEDQLEAHVAAHGSELARLVPALASRIPDLPPTQATDSDTERYLLFARRGRPAGQVGADQPVVLVLDDLQWADQGSLLLLRHLATSDAPMRLLILGTFRDSELSHVAPAARHPGRPAAADRVSRIELAGLDDTGVLELMEAAAGHTLDDAGSSWPMPSTGRPTATRSSSSEVLRHLAETGAIFQDATGRWVPEETLESRPCPTASARSSAPGCGRLGTEAEQILSVAAVIGRTSTSTCWPVPPTSTRTTFSMSWTPRRGRPGPGGRRPARQLQLRPRPHPAHPVRGPGCHPPGPGPPHGGRSPRGPLRGPPGNPGGRAGPSLVQRHPADRPRQGDLLLRARPAMPPWPPWPRPTHCATTPRHSSSSTRSTTPTPRGPRPGHRPGNRTAPDRRPRVPGRPCSTRTPGGRPRRHRPAGGGGPGQRPRLASTRSARPRQAGYAGGRRGIDSVPTGPTGPMVLATICSGTDARSRRRHAGVGGRGHGHRHGFGRRPPRRVGRAPSPLRSPGSDLAALLRGGPRRGLRPGDRTRTRYSHESNRVSVVQSGGVGRHCDLCWTPRIPVRMDERTGEPFRRWSQAMAGSARAHFAGDTDRAEERAEGTPLGTAGGQPDAAMIYATQLLVVSGKRGTMGEIVRSLSTSPTRPRSSRADGYLALARAEGPTSTGPRGTSNHSAPRVRATLGPGLAVRDGGLCGGRHRVPERAVRRAHLGTASRTPKLVFNSLTREGPVSHYLGGLPPFWATTTRRSPTSPVLLRSANG